MLNGKEDNSCLIYSILHVFNALTSDSCLLRTLVGHTDIYVWGSEIQSGCNIIADGAEESDAIITVDFGQGTCDSGKTVSLDGRTISIDGSEAINFGAPFKNIIFVMTDCNDEVTISSTSSDAISIEVIGNDGDDKVILGQGEPALETNIFTDLVLDGGAGDADELVINDSGSSASKSIRIFPTMITDVLGGFNTTISYFSFENIDMLLGSSDADVAVDFMPRSTSLSMTSQDGNDSFSIENVQGPFLTINSGPGEDTILINGTMGNIVMTIDAGEDDDVITINNLFESNGTVLGGAGNDLLLLDGRGLHFGYPNTFHRSNLDWNGGEGDDMVEMWFVGHGISNLNFVDDTSGTNQAIARCIDEICDILSRSTFIANVLNPDSSDYTNERINLQPTASIYDFTLYLNGGDNTMYFDDTFCIIDVFGGDDNDSFYVGQMFNDDRTESYGITEYDSIATTLTARGYLSDGCSHPVTLYGGNGNDFYDILRNKCNIELDGERGRDVFVVRSFIWVINPEDGSIEAPSLGNATIRGGEDVDDFYIASHNDPVEDMPPYIVNNYVDIDGGIGRNNLTIYGTEQNDKYVVENGLVSSGGLSINYINIAYLAVAGEAVSSSIFYFRMSQLDSPP